MSPYMEQLTRHFFGDNPPRPFEDKTPEEREQDKQKFLQALRDMPPVTDEQIDEIFLGGRINDLKLRVPDFSEEEAESA